jgi:glucose-1-phosphate thymidylyltransferase
MKGIILAGGAGTRLYPLTNVVCKQLLPVYDKPMIYYPLSALMLAGIREILIISTPADLPRFESIFGDGSAWGLKLSYKVQPSPKGIAQALLLAEDFLGKDDACLVLGDNIFYGHGLPEAFKKAVKAAKGGKATVFGYYVNDPQRYGVVAFDKAGKAVSIDEKPAKPRSNYAVTGLYFYPNAAVKTAAAIKPSSRGELEITDVNKAFLKRKALNMQLLGRGYAWLDTGTFESLLEAGEFISTVEKRQGLKIACIEEIAYNQGWIDRARLLKFAAGLSKNAYGAYLRKIADGN